MAPGVRTNAPWTTSLKLAGRDCCDSSWAAATPSCTRAQRLLAGLPFEACRLEGSSSGSSKSDKTSFSAPLSILYSKHELERLPNGNDNVRICDCLLLSTGLSGLLLVSELLNSPLVRLHFKIVSDVLGSCNPTSKPARLVWMICCYFEGQMWRECLL